MAGLSFNELTEAVGASLADAQGALTAGISEPPNRMALSDVNLELKVAVETGTDGKLRVTPVSAEATRSGALNVGALSTVILRFAAFADDTPKTVPVTPPTGGPKIITDREAIKRVADAADLKRLERALGPFTFETNFVEARTAWLVTVKGADGDTVRETVVPAAKA